MIPELARWRVQRHGDDLRPVNSRGRPDLPGSSIRPSIPSASYLARQDVSMGGIPHPGGDLGVAHIISRQQDEPARWANLARIGTSGVYSNNRF